MSEYVPLLGLFATIIIAYYNHQQQQRVIHQQAEEINQQAEQLEELRKGERRERIEKYYPPLAKNLRLSLPDISYRYIQGYQEHGIYFDVLLDMANKSTLSIIEALDKTLYDDLKSILDHFLPTEREIDRKKDESWKEIPRKWQKWVEEYNLSKYLSGTTEEFVENLSGSLQWGLWRGDEKLVWQNFERVYATSLRISRHRVKGDKQKILGELTRIAEEEWTPIKEEYEKLQQDLHDLVEKKILLRMDETLRSLGE